MPVWTAVAQVAPLIPDALGGSAGAFVFTVGPGLNRDEFQRSVSEALGQSQLLLVELDEVATISAHVNGMDEEIASLWLEVAGDVERSQEPYFDEFHAFDQPN